MRTPCSRAGTLPASPVLALMALGILMAIGGHVVGNSRVVGLGLAIVFLATALMFLGGFRPTRAASRTRARPTTRSSGPR